MKTHEQSITIQIAILVLLISLNSCNRTTPTPIDNPIYYPESKFVMGADLSYVNAIESQGTIYKDVHNVAQDPYVIFKKLGTNLVRVRKWHTPSWQNNLYGSIRYHESEDVKKTIKRSKTLGMKVLLNLHYSDNWADPHKQETPKAWINLPLNTLIDSIYQYTFQYLKELEKEDLVPEYIQIGNENNGGICYPMGAITQNNFTNFVKILNAGSQAIRDFSINSKIKPKIIIHTAQFDKAQWWIEGIQRSGIALDYDILGVSHYYKWAKYNTMYEVTDQVKMLIQLTSKKLWVVETAYPWTIANKDTYANILSNENLPSGFVINKSDQNRYLTELTQAIIDGGGTGIIYWEPGWISSPLEDQWGVGSSWENATFFDFQNKAHETLKYMTYQYKF